MCGDKKSELRREMLCDLGKTCFCTLNVDKNKNIVSHSRYFSKYDLHQDEMDISKLRLSFI